MVEHITTIRDILERVKTGKCIICSNDLHMEFPNDFPDEWKFCCQCKVIAEMITEGVRPKEFRAFGNIAYKIEEKITLVKGNWLIRLL